MTSTTSHIDNKKQLIPELRFREFDGEWFVRKLGDLGVFRGGGTPSTTNSKFWEGKIPWISSSDIKEDDIHNINIHRYLNEDAVNKSATKIIPQKSVLLISRVGVGKLAINEQELCTSQDFSNFTPNECSSYYIGYYLLARKNILLNFEQGTSIKGFTTNDIKTLKVKTPTLPEQQKIAAFLTAVDKKIQQLTRKKQLLEQYKKGVMQKIFPPVGGQVPEIRFKPSCAEASAGKDDGSDYPDWEEKRLSEFLIFTLREVPKPSNNYLAIGIRSHCKGTFQKPNSDPSKIAMEKLFVVRENDLVVNITFAWEGAIALVRKEDDGGLVSHRFPTYRFDREIVIHEFFKFVFVQKRFRFTLDLISPGGAGRNRVLSKKELLKIKWTLPLIEEQKKIADFLSNIDNKIESVNKQIEHTQKFKKGLLQQMFV